MESEDRNKNTPLHLAAKLGHEGVVQVSFHKHIDKPESRNSKSPEVSVIESFYCYLVPYYMHKLIVK